MFQVGQIVWHSKFKRGEVAQSVGTSMSVMFDDVQYNPLISTEAPPYISKKDLAEILRAELKQGLADLDKELEGQNIPPEERNRLREERSASIVREIESIKEASRKAPLDGHTIYWDVDVKWEVPTLRDGQPDPKFKYPTISGYYMVVKAIQPVKPYRDRKTGEIKFHPVLSALDMTLKNNMTGATYYVRINNQYIPAFPTAKEVPQEELSLLIDQEDSFGGFFEHSK